MAIRLFSEYASSRCQDTKSTTTTTTTSTSENEQLTDTIRSLLETVQLLIKYIRQVQKNRQSKLIMSSSTITIDDNNEIINGKNFTSTPTTISLVNDLNLFGDRCLELSKIISPQIAFKLREHIQNIKDISKPLLDNDDNRDETYIFSQMTKILQDIKIILDKL
jgi:predicted lipase